jgi:hypothetical protein
MLRNSRVSVCFIFVRSTAYLSYTVIMFARSSERAPNSFLIFFFLVGVALRRATPRSAQGCKFILCISLKVDETKYLEIFLRVSADFHLSLAVLYTHLCTKGLFPFNSLISIIACRQTALPGFCAALVSRESYERDRQYLVGLSTGVQPHQA